MKLETLQDLLVDHIKDLYSAETQIVKALPKMEKAAGASELQAAFRKHLKQTEEHVRRLEEVSNMLNTKPAGKKCVGMEGLLKEGDELLKEDADPEVLDAGLIAAAQKVEHYEISGYGTARTYAEMLGNQDVASLLQKTLDEEAQTDESLTKLAQSRINVKAAQ
ncbi:MAG: ferritin-like domain-containing protein [Anaerolineae bacterium]|nr:ferritin-like domain-containing protein [Anaerolineae bacterium]